MLARNRGMMWGMLLVLVGATIGCGGKASTTSETATKASAKSNANQTISITGSDTMVMLVQAWAEKYQGLHPNVDLEVKGGGSGVGISALINGTVDIASSSRKMEPAEIEKCKANGHSEPVEFHVGGDALAIYVHPSNPMPSITIKQLAGVFGAEGKVRKWSDLGVTIPDAKDDSIVAVSRANSSGTYHYFKEAILGKGKEYRQDVISQAGTADLVAFVSKTPTSIGYSGMGYKSDSVRFLPVSKEEGQPGVTPSIESALDGSYPIFRPLFLYTAKAPEGVTKEFLDWVVSDEGQAVVKDMQYIPLAK